MQFFSHFPKGVKKTPPRYVVLACVVIMAVMSIVFTSTRSDSSGEGYMPSLRRLQTYDAAMAGIDGPVTR